MTVMTIQKVETLKTEDMMRTLMQIKKANEVMDFFDTMVHPYSFAIPVKQMVKSAEDFPYCDKTSKQILRAEINGLVDIINHWIEVYNEPRILVRYLAGKKIGLIKPLAKSVAEELIECGLVERV